MTDIEARQDLTGGCQCGAVRYRLTAMPEASLCHCRMCQKAVGGPFAALGAVPVGNLVWVRGAPALFDSSSVASRGFCRDCGTPLTYQARSIDSDRIEITLGSLDDPNRAAPQSQFGIESRVRWLDSLPGLPASPTDAKFAGVVSRQHPDGTSRDGTR